MKQRILVAVIGIPALLAVLCFGGYNVWRNQGIPFVWGSWCDWGSLQNVVDTVLVFLLLNSIRYSTPPTSITRFTGYLSKLTLGAYLVSWIPDNYLYTMLKSAVPSVTDQLNYFPLTVGGTILISLLLAMLGGRVVSGIANAVFMGMAGTPYGFQAFVTASFVTAVPGIVIQIILIPVLVMALEKAGFCERIKRNTI